MNSRERVMARLSGQPADHLPFMPITMMFASRHAGFPYGRYALDYRVLAEAQIRTAMDFGFDHVSTITETREALDCGATVQFFEDQPYAIDESQACLADKGVLSRLQTPNPTSAPHMSDRLDGIALLKERTGGGMIVEGWVEGPCGAAADLRGIQRLMTDFYDDPPFVRDLFEFVLQLAIQFGKAQTQAGADVIGVGDPAASLVGPRLYREYVLSFEKRLVDALHSFGTKVRLHICGDTRRILQDVSSLGCDIVDIDSKVSIRDARQAIEPRQVLLGGIDPVRVLQNGQPEEVSAAAARCHEEAGAGYIVGAGCEVPRDTPELNLRALKTYATTNG